MQLRLGFELDASVAHPRGEAVIDLDFSAANGQAVVTVRSIKIDSGNVVLDLASRTAVAAAARDAGAAIEPGPQRRHCRPAQPGLCAEKSRNNGRAELKPLSRRDEYHFAPMTFATMEVRPDGVAYRV